MSNEMKKDSVNLMEKVVGEHQLAHLWNIGAIVEQQRIEDWNLK